MKIISIIGTNTEVGKTIVSASLFNYLKSINKNVFLQKWVSTGDKYNFSEDLFFSLNIKFIKENESPFKSKINRDKIKKQYSNYLKSMNPYSLKFPASPHLSCKLENKKISKRKIEKALNSLKKESPEYLIIEGVGGIMTPLNEKLLYVDLLEEFKIPVFLVIGNFLGAINASLLTINELKRRKIKIYGYAFNNYFKGNEIIKKDNIKIISKISYEKNTIFFNKLNTKRNFLYLGKNIYKFIK